ncbi:GntR family transcriptional regulator [Streptomyces sp. NPDC051956]|uniref:GntR family transcriptional regulator n=1 Tax=Streptomyces sp. NPDC051956 TaxID=3365677 RepID=UPI0037D1C935
MRESAIAAELGIARNTVREAVRLLEHGGLVRFDGSRGAVTVSPTPATADELYTARKHLESAALTTPLTDSQCATVERAFDDFVAAAGTRERAATVASDLAFHASIVANLDNSRIESFYATLTRELRFYLMALSAHEREDENPSKVVAGHEPLMAAIRVGDAGRAQCEVRDHIATNAARVQGILAGRDGD